MTHHSSPIIQRLHRMISPSFGARTNASRALRDMRATPVPDLNGLRSTLVSARQDVR